MYNLGPVNLCFYNDPINHIVVERNIKSTISFLLFLLTLKTLVLEMCRFNPYF